MSVLKELGVPNINFITFINFIPWFPHEVTKEWIFPNIPIYPFHLPPFHHLHHPILSYSLSSSPSSSSHPPPPHAVFFSGDERRGARRCNQPWRSGEPGPKQAGVHSCHFGHHCLHFVIMSWIIHIMIRSSSFQSPLGWSSNYLKAVNNHDLSYL